MRILSINLKLDYVEVDQIDSDDDQEDSEKKPDNNDEYTNNDE